MKDFVVYHNPDVIGKDVRAVNPLEIFTNKPAPADVVGSRVWLLTGEGKPRRFLLRSYFIVDMVDSGMSFQTILSGRRGKVFDPMIELNHEEWFKELKRSQGNFAFGLQPVKQEKVIRGLQRVAETSS